MTNLKLRVALLGVLAVWLAQCSEEAGQVKCPELKLYNVRDASPDIWDSPEFRAALDAGCITKPVPQSEDAGVD